MELLGHDQPKIPWDSLLELPLGKLLQLKQLGRGLLLVGHWVVITIVVACGPSWRTAAACWQSVMQERKEKELKEKRKKKQILNIHGLE